MGFAVDLLSEGQLVGQDCFLERKDGVVRNILIYAHRRFTRATSL